MNYWDGKGVDGATMRYISLGAGVQSSVMALMASRGEIGPMPDCAVFADTQWEPESVYTHLEWLEKQLSFPVYRVTHGDIREISLQTLEGIRAPSMPVFIDTDKGGISRRQCTLEFKIMPIKSMVKELIGYKKGQKIKKGTQVECWMGISRDEIQRMKDSNDHWVVNRWPLIEKRMSRNDCGVWFKEYYPDRVLPKSASIGCPYRSDQSWRNMKDNDPTSWIDAVDFDKSLRSGERNAFGMKSPVYLHSSMTPLGEVSLDTEEDLGQLNMFGAECEGMCGV